MIRVISLRNSPVLARVRPRDMDTSRVRADFDRIAELSAQMPDRAGPYEPWLLRQCPGRIGRALDAGCGLGHLSRQLAHRSDEVLAIDLSPRMIEIARERSREISNLKFEIADLMAIDLPPESFDCIVSLATLHHLPMRDAMIRLCNWLKPGGVLGIIDLVHSSGLLSALPALAAAPFTLGARMMLSSDLRRAWRDHGRLDAYPTIQSVRKICEDILPGATVRRHVRWRYSLLWKKPLMG